MRWKFFLVTLLFHSSHYDFAQALKETCSRSLTSHSYGEYPYRGEFQVADYAIQTTFKVYMTRIFLSRFLLGRYV